MSSIIHPSGIVPLAAAVVLCAAPSDAQLRYPPPFPGHYGYRLAAPESHLRLAVTPREAMVYVDGYLAGTVDEFDGVFQRLHLTPGEHEITFYLPGFRTIRQHLYLSPNASRKIAETMEELGPGETTDPVPVPAEPPPDSRQAPVARDPYPFPGRGAPPRDPRQPPAPPPSKPSEPSALGSLVLRVQPADAEVFIDGERWRGPSGNERLVVQVSEGRHRVEVRKEGYAPYSNEVDVQRGASLPVNVSLAKE